jgi:hypothetical protein
MMTYQVKITGVRICLFKCNVHRYDAAGALALYRATGMVPASVGLYKLNPVDP